MIPLVIRMTIVSDATTWSATYSNHSDDHNIFYNTGHIFVVQASLMIVTYKHHNMFIVQATGACTIKLLQP
jgi:hypothetical protein